MTITRLSNSILNKTRAVAGIDLLISPAFGSNTNWTFSTQGDLYLDTPNIYTLTFLNSGTYNLKMWGAGGGDAAGSTGDGGGGGYTTGNILIGVGNIYSVVVGERGYFSVNQPSPSWQITNYGGGGKTYAYSGSGGGYTGFFLGSNVSQETALLIAGGGGGAGQAGSVNTFGGAGGGSTGENGGLWQFPVGTGGTQSAGGGGSQNSGSKLQGGDVPTAQGGGGGAGGGGYWGGGSAYGTSTVSASGGGGGSGYVSPVIPGGVTVAGSGATAGNSSDPVRGSAGAGGTGAAVPQTAPGNGGNGRMVIKRL